MQVTFKLFATLMEYLPPGSHKNAATITVDQSTTINQLINRYKVPRDLVHLVLLNGMYVDADDRDRELVEGDTLAIWPPVAGG